MLRPVSDDRIEATLQALTQEGAPAPGKTRHLVVGHGLLPQVAPWLAQSPLTPGAARDLVICDEHTRAAAGLALVEQLRSQGREAETFVLDPQPNEDHVVCDDGIIEALRQGLANAGPCNAIAVGSGTINDTVKMATFKLGMPFVCIPTAASMNGYTSAIAAVLSRGVKRTLAAQQAVAVFADIDIIRRAPAYLNGAGFGDLLSKPYSHADWLLSHFVRGVAYEERPARLLDDAYETLLERADSVGAAEDAGIGTLTRTILLSGFTMAIAGSSAPASGGEHLVSHYWDMEQHCRGLPLFGLHGEQVGVATRMSAIMFERLVGLEVGDLDVEAAVRRRSDPAWIDHLPSLHPRLTPPVVEEVREQLLAKQKHGDALRDELGALKKRWPEIRACLAAVLKPSSKIAQALTAAGAPDRPSALGVERAHAIATFRVCRQIRNRYVALDLCDDLGFLHDWAETIVNAVEVT